MTELPCCNIIEKPDLTAVKCDGTMRLAWPVFVCDTCHAQCGALAHPQHQEFLT